MGFYVLKSTIKNLQMKGGANNMNDSTTESTIKEKEKVTFLYNMLQVNFYLSKGICPLEIGINSTTKRTWVKFGWYDSTKAYEEWCTRKR